VTSRTSPLGTHPDPVGDAVGDPPPREKRFAIPFSEIMLDMLPQVGGKNASLGELVRELTWAGVAVPDGFALPVAAYRRSLTPDSLPAVARRLAAG